MSDQQSSGSFAKELLNVNIEDQMEESYLDYAMSVIVGRALPNVRDGLKPVHRRIFHAMNQAGNDWNKAYKKSARIVGDVLGKYHPHSQDAVYDAIVRMAQTFSLRYPLIDGQGNFGSVDGDNPAAMRYTEVRMAKLAHQLLEDVDKETVTFVPNYDNSETEPTILPTRLPNLLVNGSSGIAVGMATNIPPHNLREVIKGCLAVLENKDINIEELMKIVPAPDFPTGGTIHGSEGVSEAYRTGRGRIVVRGKAEFENLDKSGSRKAIVITELPFQVNKANLVKNIADLIRNKKIEGISDIRDESDRKGMRIFIELRRNLGDKEKVILNQLYKETALQESFSVNMVALVDQEPKLLNLREMLRLFIEHRHNIIVRRTVFDLGKAKQRAHVLEGYTVAISNVDAIVQLIKQSPTPKDAKERLMREPWASSEVLKMLGDLEDSSLTVPEGMGEIYGVPMIHFDKASYIPPMPKNRYRLSSVQAQAILELRLQRFTGMEQDKILADYKEVVKNAIELQAILDSPAKVNKIIRIELEEVDKNFSDKRRTQISDEPIDIDVESLVPSTDMLVMLSHKGYIKTMPTSTFNTQRRGGQGKRSAPKRDDDFTSKVFIANTLDYLMCFTNRGRVYWIKVYELPQVSGGQSRGQPIVNMLSLMEGEHIQAVLPIKKFSPDSYVVFATEKGVVKKTSLDKYANVRSTGIAAINLGDDDSLVNVERTDGSHSIMLFSETGKAIHFEEKEVRATGRASQGVRGIRLKDKDKVVSMITSNNDSLQVFAATETGFGKKTPISKYRLSRRAGLGIIAINTGGRNGKLVGALGLDENDEVMLLSQSGNLTRLKSANISKTAGRAAMGVRLIKLADVKNNRLSNIAKVAREDDEEDPENIGGG